MTWWRTKKETRPAAEVAALHARIADLEGQHRVDVKTVGALTLANRQQELKIMSLEHMLEGIAAQFFAFEERLLAAVGGEDTNEFTALVPIVAAGAVEGAEFVHKATGKRIRLERRRVDSGDGWLAVYVGGSGREWWLADEDLVNEYTQVEVQHVAA